MSLLFNMPMKFECRQCQSSYMHPYQLDHHHYPACPHCSQPGLLLGIAEASDLIHHPVDAMNSYLLWAKSKLTAQA